MNRNNNDDSDVDLIPWDEDKVLSLDNNDSFISMYKVMQAPDEEVRKHFIRSKRYNAHKIATRAIKKMIREVNDE